MLTILTFSLVLAIVVLGRHVFTPNPKMQTIKIKPQQRYPKRKY
jgi:hypothetical protein